MEPRSSFVGRADDQAALLALLPTTPLVTLIGVGGVGKTRLALRTSARAATDFPDGVHVVELAAVESDGNVGEALASALGHGSLEGALSHLSDASALLVVDNCEHVVEPVAEVVDQLLQRCGDLRILATSRVALELPGEVLHPLRPLEMNDACSLLQDRAATSGVQLDIDEPMVLLAGRLDGLPLAIELAASRLRSLGPNDIVAALDASSRILRARRSRDDARHGSIEAAITWSYDLLAAEEARALRAMAVFGSAFTVEKAHAVIGADGPEIDTIDLIDRLVAHSLLSAERSDGATSYRMLELIRTFAADRLQAEGEREQVRERFVDVTLEAVMAQMREARHGWSRELIASILDVAVDVLQAMRICLEIDEESKRAFRLFLPSFGIVHYEQAAEFADVGQRLLTRWPDRSQRHWADVAALIATAYLRIVDLESATTWAEASIDAGEEDGVAPVARRVLGLTRAHQGRWAEAAELLDRSAADAEQLGMMPMVAEIRAWQSLQVARAGDLERGIKVAADALDWGRRTGSYPIYTLAGAHEAYLHMEQDIDLAIEMLDIATADSGPDNGNWIPRRMRGAVAVVAGRPSEASSWLRDALDASRRGGELWHSWATMRWVGLAAIAVPSLTERGVVLLAATETSPLTPAPDPLETTLLAPVAEAIGRQPVSTDPDKATRLAYELLDRLAELSEEDHSNSESGSESPLESAAAEPPVPESVFRRSGELWELAWGDETAVMAASKGLADLARLVSEPNREIAAVDLMGSRLQEPGVVTGPDLEARRSYEQRLRELQAEIDKAETDNDPGRAEVATLEFDRILSELTAGQGLGGRDRTAGGSTEKARSAVTSRIRASIKKIDRQLPGMARHLRLSIKTGTWCAYQPEHARNWRTE